MQKYAFVVDGFVEMIYEFEDWQLPQVSPPIEYVRVPDGLNIEFGDPCVNGIFGYKRGSVEDVKAYLRYGLWRKATNYQETWISGAATASLVIGVMQRKPKCMAAMQWILTIWNGIYYPQKALISAGLTTELPDFSCCGPMPYSVPELQEEIFS